MLRGFLLIKKLEDEFFLLVSSLNNSSLCFAKEEMFEEQDPDNV